MNLKVVFYNILYSFDPTILQETTEYTMDIDDTTTLKLLIENAGVGIADLSEYYFLSGRFTWNTQIVPYVVNSSGAVEWDVSFQSIKVKDFLLTHGIENNTLIAKTGYPQAGGPGFKELNEIWQMIYPVLDGFATVVGVVGILNGVGKWVRSLFKQKDIPPQSYFDLLFSREMWNSSELAKMLDIEPENAKSLLKLFGYQYNTSKMLFVQQDVSHTLREKLSKINVNDI